MDKDRERWLPPLLILLPLALYAQTIAFDFVDFDDVQYILANPHVSSGLSRPNLFWAFFSLYASNWHPLTWIAHMADVSLFGLTPGGPHAVNALLHAVNTVLVFLVFRDMTGARGRSAWVAALFAVHPLHVESVAYIAERKDVLSAFFWLTSIAAYVGYVRHRGAPRYALLIGLFTAGLLSKPMVITLPLVLLVLDYWPLERVGSQRAMSIRALIAEKLPLIALSCLSALITLVAQIDLDRATDLASLSLIDNLATACIAYAGYLRQTVWPVGLAAFYPRPDALSWSAVAGSLAVVIALTGAAVRARAGHPYLLAGWLWYLVTLVPVIGLVPVGSQLMADRYTYLPLLGVFIMVAWGAVDIASRWRIGDRAVIGAALASLMALAIVTWMQIGYWRNGVTLFERAIAVTDGNALGHHNLGVALVNRGRSRDAIAQFTEALRLNPRYPRARLHLGHAYLNAGETQHAIESYEQSLAAQPDDPETRRWLEIARARLAHHE